MSSGVGGKRYTGIELQFTVMHRDAQAEVEDQVRPGVPFPGQTRVGDIRVGRTGVRGDTYGRAR